MPASAVSLEPDTAAAASSHAAVNDSREGWWKRLDRPRLALLIVFGGWLVIEAAVLSLSKGIVHPYYVSALGPGVAAMFGAGAYAFAQFATRRDWRLLLLAGAAAATVPAQLALLRHDHYMSWFTAPLIAATVVTVALVGLLSLVPSVRRAAPAAIALVLGVLLIAPGVYAASNWLAPVQSTFPAAGLRAAAGPGGYGVDTKHVAVDRALLRYVASHGQGSRWSVLADASNTASPMILLGSDAGSLGGFSGTDPALDGPGLGAYVRGGQARYVLLGGEFSTRGGTKATEAVQQACRVVHTRSWLPRPLRGTREPARGLLSRASPRPGRWRRSSPAWIARALRRRRRARGETRARTARSRGWRPIAARPPRRRRRGAARPRHRVARSAFRERAGRGSARGPRRAAAARRSGPGARCRRRRTARAAVRDRASPCGGSAPPER
jgi:hypothetical protein